MHVRQTILGIHYSLFCSLQIELGGTTILLHDGTPLFIQHSQRILGTTMALGRTLTKPLQRQHRFTTAVEQLP